jgi:hypothetical protein
MTGLFREVFKGVQIKLIENVDLTNGLLTRLLTKGVLTDRQYAECKVRFPA